MNNPPNEKYHQIALNKVRSLMKLKPSKGSVEGQELEMLITLIEAYEDRYFPMKISDPIAFVQYRIGISKL